VQTMTIGIPSFNRRAEVARLLRALGEELASSPEIRDGLDVLVVLDGSNDGSEEALASIDLPVPLRVIWQPNLGLASARNRLIRETYGELLLFLDDDMVPSSRLIERHRRGHDDKDPAVLMGACLYPDGCSALPVDREYWVRAREVHAVTGTVESYDDFSAANTSAPTELLREVGGFDEGFVDYGCEDWELGFRLLEAD